MTEVRENNQVDQMKEKNTLRHKAPSGIVYPVGPPICTIQGPGTSNPRLFCHFAPDWIRRSGWDGDVPRLVTGGTCTCGWLVVSVGSQS